MQITEKIVNGVYGQYKWQVLDSQSQEIVHQSPTLKNYIFNSGLDFVATYNWADCFRYCRLGNQTNPTSSTGTYESLYGAALQAPVLGASGVSGPPYYTGIVGAPYFFSGCITLPITGEDGCTSGLKMRRTFDFGENPVGEFFENNDIVYTEIGWSPESGGALFSRIITNTGDPNIHVPISVKEGQFLRVIYELTVSFPSGATLYDNPITGYEGNSSGQAKIQLLGLSCVNETGGTTFWDSASGANEPSRYAYGWLSDSSDPLALIGSKVDRSTGNFYSQRAHLFNYTNNTFERVKRMFVSGDYAVNSGWYSFGLGASGTGINDARAANNNTFSYLFDTGFNKEQDYILNVLFKYSWDRQ